MDQSVILSVAKNLLCDIKSGSLAFARMTPELMDGLREPASYCVHGHRTRVRLYGPLCQQCADRID